MKAKKIFTLLLISVLAFPSLCSYAESITEDQEEKVDEIIEELEETSSTFTVPISVGPIYSVIIRRDGFGIVFSMIKSKSLSLGLEALSFLTDIKEIDVFLENGEVYTVPAVLQILSQEVGSFIVINISGKAAQSLMAIFNSKSPATRFAFIQNSENRYEMTIDEVNKAIEDATGKTTDIVKQASEAITTFWNNISSGIGRFTSDVYAGAEKAVVDAGDYIANTATEFGDFVVNATNSAGEYLNDAKNTAGEYLEDAKDTATEFLDGAIDSAGEAINGALEDASNLWKNLWGH